MKTSFRLMLRKAELKKIWINIADCETFSVSFDNGVEEWASFYGRRMGKTSAYQ